jgi:ketosteroid isomerase-like protein
VRWTARAVVDDDPGMGTHDAERATAERNRAIALKVNGMTGVADDDEYLAYFNDDPAWHVNRRVMTGRDGLRQLAATVRRVFPNGLEREVTATVAEGDRVVIQHVNRAVVGSGAAYENEYVKIFEFDPDGRIRAVWEYLDSAHAAAVLGLSGPPVDQ